MPDITLAFLLTVPLKVEKSFRQILSFSEEMEARGSRPGSKVLSFETVSPGPEVAGVLRLAPGEKVIRLRRIRMADSLPMGVECSFLWARLFPDFGGSTLAPRCTERLQTCTASRSPLSMKVSRSGWRPPKKRNFSKSGEGSPIFVFSRTSHIHSGQPVEYVKSFYRGDRYKIVHRLRQQDRDKFLKSRESRGAFRVGVAAPPLILHRHPQIVTGLQ
jgi:GntR family transcriptional regulator